MGNARKHKRNIPVTINTGCEGPVLYFKEHACNKEYKTSCTQDIYRPFSLVFLVIHPAQSNAGINKRMPESAPRVRIKPATGPVLNFEKSTCNKSMFLQEMLK